MMILGWVWLRVVILGRERKNFGGENGDFGQICSFCFSSTSSSFFLLLLLLLSFFFFSFFFQFRFDYLYEFVYGVDEFGSRFRTILMVLWCVFLVVLVVGGTGLQWWWLAMLGCGDVGGGVGKESFNLY